MVDSALSLRFKSEEEAKKKARDDLKALIKSSGGRLNSRTLHTLREEMEHKKDEVDRELIFNIEKKVSEISKGVQMLSEKEEVTKDIRTKISSIKDIWKNSCGRFADISQEVDQLLQSKRYVEQVLSMLQNFLDMESRVEELQSKLTDEDEIFNVYKKIKIMNYMRTSFLQKIESQQQSASTSTKLQKIKEHFRAVSELERNFHEGVIQGNLQNIHALAQKNPSLLVKVIRIIENDEITQNSLDSKYSQREEEERKRQQMEQINRDSELPSIMQQQFRAAKNKDEEKKESMRDKSINIIKMCAKRRAIEFFSAEVNNMKEGARGQFMALLQRSESLINDLKFIKNQVDPCFPPTYKVLDMHFEAYKKELQDKVDSMLNGPQMDRLLNEDPEAILFFSGFIQHCQQLVEELHFQDDFFMNLQIRLQEFYPRFMDHAESKILERLQRILEEQKSQEAEKVEQFQSKTSKKKKVIYETTLAGDIFDFMTSQLEAISESLKGEKLIEFVKRMMDQLCSMINHIVSSSMEFEARNPKVLIELVIRLNDLSKVAQEFGKFKEQAITSIGEPYSERVDNVLDEYFRQMIENANTAAEIVALFIVRSEIEQELFLTFFTVNWKDNHEILLKEVLKAASGYMQDVFKIVQEENFAGKIVSALYSMLVDAYVERFVIAVNMRYKLKLPFEKPLLSFIYADALLSKTNKDKLILKKDLVDFYSKTIDQELFELMQSDLKHFQEFREAYKDDILQQRFTKKIQLLSLISLMLNSTDEADFGTYEDQFWGLLGGTAVENPSHQMGPGGISIQGYHIVRVCRKIKTKNGRQKGFFKKTKQKEKNMMKKK